MESFQGKEDFTERENFNVKEQFNFSEIENSKELFSVGEENLNASSENPLKKEEKKTNTNLLQMFMAVVATVVITVVAIIPQTKLDNFTYQVGKNSFTYSANISADKDAVITARLESKNFKDEKKVGSGLVENTIENLKPDTNYNFSIVEKDGNGEKVIIKKAFKTSPEVVVPPEKIPNGKFYDFTYLAEKGKITFNIKLKDDKLVWSNFTVKLYSGSDSSGDFMQDIEIVGKITDEQTFSFRGFGTYCIVINADTTYFEDVENGIKNKIVYEGVIFNFLEPDIPQFI